MVTHRCRWCGGVYVPKAGAIRSYYCSRSCREKYGRWRKNWLINRETARKTESVEKTLALISWQADEPMMWWSWAWDIMGCVEPKNQELVARYLRNLFEANRNGCTTP